ncbi:MAG: peptide chain release factor N(5)-glutamine methyltransferase [Reyranella sp.]|uniref:peptide chain release factor N(5)-glutamine methyltransferase n=1 Tax=Reyranella sp. TaxID=1929291 RepID=UPI001209F3FF|nr:peptide chain release factor N(5)-glutamine methyltransferase [Reyranella sp.]TAJ40172.1 MAG: peptide chain release factor N(5)-glutamine methyltransferase [Reyranella sp.]
MSGVARYDALLRDAAVALTAAGIDNARFEARLLLAHAGGVPSEWLIAHGDEVAAPAVAEAVRALTARRIRREPMAYILGEREFWGLPFKVSPAVLVPRPDSETLIEAALALMPGRTEPWRILDLGVGSGCLLLTLLREFPNARGIGMDVSPAALAMAEANADALGVGSRVSLAGGDWREPGWAGRLGGPFDLLVSNPPYIETSAIEGLMPDVARFEPRLALDGGGDGLSAYRAIARGAAGLVVPGGRVLVEAGEGQAPEISALFSLAGFAVEAPWKDLGGIDRIVAATH